MASRGHGQDQSHAQKQGGKEPGQVHLPAGDPEHRLIFQQYLLAVHLGAGQIGAGNGKDHAQNEHVLQNLKEQGGVAALGRVPQRMVIRMVPPRTEAIRP